MLNEIELQIVRELVARRGADSVTLAVAMACSEVSAAHSERGDDTLADGWMAFAKRMTDEYLWCNTHLC